MLFSTCHLTSIASGKKK